MVLQNIQSKKTMAIFCVCMIFVIIFWFFYLHLPALKDGYLNAGDDHVHVAYANELKKIREEEGRFFGWSRLYAMGAPIFLLRPPGFYVSVNAVHAISGFTIEQSLKIVVLLGFCLFPLSVYIGARMLELERVSAAISGLLSPLCISLWGHTLDAYQHLGIHKQLLAIFIFPIAVGALWQVLKNGKYGVVFALSFAFMFMTHPYIAYCYALLSVLMIPALGGYGSWNFTSGIRSALLWAAPAILFIFIWLIPFIASSEIQCINPYLSRRYYFEVVGCTATETLRQYFLGGILDTTFYSGVFGGTQWTGGNEWGWLDNSAWPRFPIITLLSFLGWGMVVFWPKKANRCFLGLAFLLSFLLLAGPDDYPFLDKIPFAEKFQNIHAIFMFEWAAILLGGMALYEIYLKIFRIPGNYTRAAGVGVLGALIVFGFGTAYYERTRAAQKMVDVKNVYTQNGKLILKKDANPLWMTFNEVVRRIEKDPVDGNIAAFPQEHEDSVLYNLLPNMVNRSVSISGFETLGGVYSLMLNQFRTDLRDNYHLQKLFNIRFVINNPFLRGKKLGWHEETEKIFEKKYWELVKVKGDFGKLQVLPARFIGFTGSETEWDVLMQGWLEQVREKGLDLPWIVNFSHAGMKKQDLENIRGHVSYILCGKNAKVPEGFGDFPKKELSKMSPAEIREMVFADQQGGNQSSDSHSGMLTYEVVQDDRKVGIYEVTADEPITPVLFKQAFYRGWEARLDGKRTGIYRISPGLQMVLIPKGEHTLIWRYTGPNHWNMAKLSFGLGILLTCLLAVRQRFFMKNSKHPVLESRTPNELSVKVIRRGIGAVWILFIGLFCFQVLSEVYYKKPVLIHPKNGQVLDQEKKTIFWNYVAGVPVKAQVFELEISKDKDFRDILLAQKIQKNEFQPKLTKKDSKPFYYRLRLVVYGKPFKWSDPVKFFL
jgi:hypothetical protein